MEKMPSKLTYIYIWFGGLPPWLRKPPYIIYHISDMMFQEPSPQGDIGDWTSWFVFQGRSGTKLAKTTAPWQPPVRGKNVLLGEMPRKTWGKPRESSGNGEKNHCDVWLDVRKVMNMSRRWLIKMLIHWISEYSRHFAMDKWWEMGMS